MVIMTPTSVSGSGVTSSGGLITLSAATAPIINGVFTSSYENYKMLITDVSGSTTSLFSIRLTVAGTPQQGATDYGYSLLQSASAGAWINLDFNSSGTSLMAIGYKTTSGKSNSTLEISSPNFAVSSNILVSGAYVATPYVGGGAMGAQIACDGFTIVPSSGNITAKIRVYGYQNS